MDVLSSFSRDGPGSDDEIAHTEAHVGLDFPPDYRSFLTENGGGEGFVGEGYARLASPTELIGMHDGYEDGTLFEGLVLIGSNGGGEAFAIDRNSDRYVMTPFIGDAPDTRIDAAGTLAEFIAFIERGAPPT
jgi:hypothetical protein